MMADFKSRNAVSPVIRRASAGQACTLRIPGVCRDLPEYTVGAHLRLFNLAGINQKPDDLFIIDACDACHTALDTRRLWEIAEEPWKEILHALIATQRRRRKAGLILLKGEC